MHPGVKSVNDDDEGACKLHKTTLATFLKEKQNQN
jgi:hypothetical protein